MKLNLHGILVLMLVLVTQLSFAQGRIVSGVVSENTGLPFPGVSVLIKGTQIGTQTDIDGKYSIKAAPNQVLIFSFIGNKTQEVKATATKLNIKMESTTEQLDEVVLIGYGSQKKREITGSQSSIKGRDLDNLVTASFESQLAGRAAGVQVVTNSGILGAAPIFRIRGVASITGGTYPLIIVDGVPIVTGDTGGVASTNGLGDINPNDIESYEILKDGAATAIYGSRAANGVVLITTKSGKKGSIKTSFNNSYGFSNAVKLYDLLQTPDFLTISKEKGNYAAGSTYNTDWQKATLKSNAAQVNNTLSMSGGTDKGRFYVSLGASDLEGIATANDMKRYTVRTNVDANVTKWLTIGTNIGLTKTEYNGLNTGGTTGNALSGSIYAATKMLPNTPIYDAANAIGYNLDLVNNRVGQADNIIPIANNLPNIVYILDKNKYSSKITRILASAFASAKITPDLEFRMQGSIDNSINKGFQYLNPVNGDGFSSQGYLYNDNTEYLRYNWQNILNYNKTFATNHTVGITAVSEYQKQNYDNFWGEGKILLNEFYNKGLITNAYSTKDSGGSQTQNGIMSYVGRINYNFAKRYFIQASIRRDGISKLSEATRWNNFTGVSGGWTISNEKFMEGIKDVVSDLKIRGSYSEVGNTDIGNYPYLGLTSSSPYGTLNGIAYSQFGNDQLQWERSKKTDFGVDLGLFNNKVNLTFDYFKNNVDQLILAAPTAPSLGIPFNTVNKNIGSLDNKGLEFSASYKLVKGNFSWNVSANVTFIENKVNKLFAGQDILYDYNIIREGEPLKALYGYRYYGVNATNGNPIYYKADNTLVEGNANTSKYTVYDPANPGVTGAASSLDASKDKSVLGNTLPTYYGALNNNFTYKGFDFGFMFRFSGGNKIFNATRRDLVTQDFSNNGTEILGRWQSATNPGDGWTPRIVGGSNTFTNLTGHLTTRFVENGDFISLDNITLGYTLPSSITKKLKIDTIRIYTLGQGLVMITKYTGINPEMQNTQVTQYSGVDYIGTPRSKTISFGVNVNF
ncbi:SusC/RagA family protein [Flavobacterium faecale]|uniref:SusC/RagA family protein n=1 Tax=Flavobacterium faecale TaxID=1355330 RepID=A0A2S1LIQ5_9FLAO|nr:TonB-dependent receptor [Flavobacterium faecale]AWG23597.1 SusC/RagA family protein [Flavobacterium faecale]